MRWSALTDIQDTFDDPISFQELKEFIDTIPPELILKYKEIYRRNDDFNKKLLTFTKNDEPELLVIGQDDGEPFGRAAAFARADSLARGGYRRRVPEAHVLFRGRGRDALEEGQGDRARDDGPLLRDRARHPVAGGHHPRLPA